MSDKALFIGSGEAITPDEVDEPSPMRLGQIDPASCRNRQRGLFAGLGIRAYAQRVGTADEVLEVAASDFLGDLMHLCDATHMDFEYLLDMAMNHYQAEIGGEG